MKTLIEKYAPAYAVNMIEDITHGFDGYEIVLKEGYYFKDTLTTMRIESTVKELRSVFKHIQEATDDDLKAMGFKVEEAPAVEDTPAVEEAGPYVVKFDHVNGSHDLEAGVIDTLEFYSKITKYPHTEIRFKEIGFIQQGKTRKTWIGLGQHASAIRVYDKRSGALVKEFKA